jgi:hypothetical protein
MTMTSCLAITAHHPGAEVCKPSDIARRTRVVRTAPDLRLSAQLSPVRTYLTPSSRIQRTALSSR